MPMWRYVDEIDRNSQVYGLLTSGDLVETKDENPPHEGVAWFEPVGETDAIDTRRLRPARLYEERWAAEDAARAAEEEANK